MEEGFSICPHCENTYTNAQIDSEEVVPCVRCYKCFVGDCGITACECVFSDDEDGDDEDAHAVALLLHYAGLGDENAHTDTSTQHLSNQEQLRKYRSQYKTKITEETKLKVGDIVYRLSEDVFMVTSVTKCFITMKYMRPSAPPIFTCEGSIVGCVDYVFKIDTSVLPDTNPSSISKKK